jgi:hypothetical protein
MGRKLVLFKSARKYFDADKKEALRRERLLREYQLSDQGGYCTNS